MIKEDHRIIKASFKGNPAAERKLFPTSHCLMPISVGQKIHEGDKFTAVIKLINQSFQRCTILVDDSVQRHTIGITNQGNTEVLYKIAVEEGDAWLVRNQDAIVLLEIPYQIMRWDDWFNKPQYIDSYLRVKQQYDTNQDYKKAIDANIDDFLTRYLSNFPELVIDYERAVALCLTYLLEECAVMCLWTDGAYDFEVYPSGRNKAMEATYEQLIKDLFPDYLKPVALRFKKYPGQTHADPINNEVNITTMTQ